MSHFTEGKMTVLRGNDPLQRPHKKGALYWTTYDKIIYNKSKGDFPKKGGEADGFN